MAASGVRSFKVTVCLCCRCCVSPRRKKFWRSVWPACVKRTPSSGRVCPLYTHAWLFMTNSTSSTASRYIYKYMQIHDLLVLKHTFKNQAVRRGTVWFGVSMKRASITKGFPAPGLAARVSAGSWKALLNNRLIPVIVRFTRKSGFHSCSFSFMLGVWNLARQDILLSVGVEIFTRCLVTGFSR